ncbi:hypothetical protein GCM10023142_22150 [Anaerocolumna aminovalerica]|uniref:Uncharacterized conserved protein n=1 Tax=Anaerocolumna aminovalerica TaxID=1527 RepID=A0A1I5DCU9_9FIRM|nr:hypothetical protein [Anaerocolumna aminovalerica]SFN97065.1 Uncharacterized conserved protein [Anaerocolumna aminovalerica]
MKKARKILMLIVIFALIISNLSGTSLSVKAATTSLSFSGEVKDIVGIPGKTVHVKLPVRAIGGYISEPRISVNTKDAPFSAENITLSAEGYSTSNPPQGIYAATTYIEFDLKVKETAKIGTYPLKIDVKFMDYSDEEEKMKEITLQVPSLDVVISEEKEPIQLTVDNVVFDNAIIGNDTELSFVIKNEGEVTALNTRFSVEGYEAAGISPKYSKLNQEAGYNGKLSAGESYQVKLPVRILSTATAGSKTLTINMTSKDIDGAEAPKVENKIYINIDENSNAPKIEIDSTKHAGELKAGSTFNLVTTLRNTGASEAKDIEVEIEGLGVESFLPNYTTKTVKIGNLKQNKKIDAKVPLIVSKEAKGGLKTVTVKISYKDNKGNSYTATNVLYLEVTAADGVSSEGKPNIVISNVTQSPNSPNAGGRVDITFDLINKSKIDIHEIKIVATNLSNTNFSPVNSDPYQYLEKLEGGKKARITMPLLVSNEAAEGVHTLEIKCEYKDNSGTPQSDPATIYVLDVQNNGAASKPKLIISNFTTDIEELRAGSTFNFLFDIYNTHSNVDAKNIKVTVSQAENVFSVTKGSNTFYIDRISAGETKQNSIELKVKSDAVTKAYPLEIKFEYEYAGAEANPTTGEIGEKVTETINLQAVENSRPVVNNIYVGSWGTPTVNQPTAVTFEFYNMGKSTLNNVYATVEGDYTLTTGNMYYIGNVQSGASEYVEMEIIPTLEGTAKGNLVISFEDSNGEEVKVTKEFESVVQGEFVPEFPGGEGTGGEFPMENPVKEPILPIWLFVIIQAAVLVVVIPVTRKIVLSLHLRKLRKKEDLELGE